MISFIIFEKDRKNKEIYNQMIRKFFYSTNDYYEIYDFDNFCLNTWDKIKKIEGKRIYIIDYATPNKNGIDISKIIRKTGDFTSPIILMKNEPSKGYKFPENTMLLNVIYKNEQMIYELWSSLEFAYKIVTKHEVFTFSIFDEVYRLPYDDIYYIEKNANDDSVTIYTKDDSYTYYISIKKILQILKKDVRFFKTHRSCIVNTFNISSYDRKNNIVFFKNGLTTSLVCRTQKKNLSDRLDVSICSTPID